MLIRSKLPMADESIALPSTQSDPVTLRIGLIADAFLFFNTAYGIWQRTPNFHSPFGLFISFFLWAMGAGSGILALSTPLHPRLALLILASVLIYGSTITSLTAL